MNALNIKSQRIKSQGGFTIIELVVVILLLGILTATALPRFMDVTDEAHDAVYDAVLGGLNIGNALFHAQFIAEGEDVTAAITEFGLQFPSDEGYAVGAGVGADDNELDDNAECLEVFQLLLQAGGQSEANEDNAVGTTATSITGPNVTVAAGLGADWLAQFVAADTCQYAYIGQFSSVADDNIPLINYDITTGAFTVGTDL
ncbi:MAG: prepilin-type N-terminal cleavage/methylation domain-containing protein [Pseudomonadales bacterium]|nr:prepilin-type N-terminal cleavage/methylation domain-containing protein [Pseudomonadales bacterium]